MIAILEVRGNSLVFPTSSWENSKGSEAVAQTMTDYFKWCYSRIYDPS